MRFQRLSSLLVTSFFTSMLASAPVLAAENLSRAEPEEVGMSSQRLARIEPLMQQYVDDGELVGATSMIARHGEVVHFETYGELNMETGQPMQEDSIFRIYSMSKPITTLAAMILYEEGEIELTAPVSRYLPELEDLRVVEEGGQLVPAQRPVTVQMLMTHTSGLTYGVFGDTLVDRQYQSAGVMQSPDLDTFIDRLGEIPLQYQPGTRFHYSVSTDVLGALVERVSGQPFGSFLEERIFDPLGMEDTFFEVPDDKVDRFGTNHTWNPQTGELEVSDRPADSNYVDNQTFQSGGGGLLSTTEDYMRFCQMLLNGGELGGERIIGSKTLEYMTQNHLPGIFGDEGASGLNLPGFAEGTGFGLGFAVVHDPAANGVVGSEGEYYWGGAAGTIFWVDPVEDLTAVVMIQHMNVQIPLRSKFKALTYAAITD